jgi:hypothetical protein
VTANQKEKPRRHLRFSLGHLFLLITALAIGLAVYRTREELSRVRASVVAMRALARELKVEDPSRVTAINRLPSLPDEMILDVHVPPGNTELSSRLCLALEGIQGYGFHSNYPEPVTTFGLAPGQHKIEIRHLPADSRKPDEEHVVEILVDDESVMRETRPNEWMPASSWTGSGSITESVSFSPDKPAELHRRRFNEKTKNGSTSKSGDEPANGILLWIDRPTN